MCSLTGVGKGSCQCVVVHSTVVSHSMPLFARTKQLHHLSMPVGKGFKTVHLHRQRVRRRKEEGGGGAIVVNENMKEREREQLMG